MTANVGELPAAPAAVDDVQVRHVRTHEEFAACVALQADTWGAAFRETVPATILKISQRIGGVTAGAFADDGALLGFVFGMTGLERGAIVHWSDMLAVRTGMQNRGLGRRLKEFQRAAVRAIGVTRMYWTYDPLVSRNAHFNLNRLGARVSEYVPNLYGADTGSAMHSGLGTDRLVVVWQFESAEGEITRSQGDDRDGAPLVPREAPVLNAELDGEDELHTASSGAPLSPVVRIEIPPDIFAVQAESAARAAHWRATSRRAFQWALANGYLVNCFEHDAAAGRAFYVLTRS